jgi:hypothetical protein
MAVLDSRCRRLTNVKVWLDLVQLDQVINWLVLQRRERAAVLAELRASAIKGEFGIIEPRHVVRDLLYLEPDCHWIRLHTLVAEERMRWLWARNPVLAQWLRFHDLPPPPWLAAAAAAETTDVTIPVEREEIATKPRARRGPRPGETNGVARARAELFPALAEERKTAKSDVEAARRLQEKGMQLPGAGNDRAKALAEAWQNAGRPGA